MTEIVSFGEWVQTRRNHLELTRAGLARLMNCAPVTIKKIERDERRPSVQIAQLLATHLQIPTLEQEDFIRRARGEFVAHFSSPAEMSLAEAQTSKTEDPNHNLPIQITPFVGREDEIKQIKTTLNDPTCRLLTILGAGGMGKTRLSIAVAQTAVSDFTDGVLFVPLAATEMKTAVDTINPLIGALADELKMTFYGNTPPELQLINYLRRKEMLLVLDNFEHLLETAVFISHLLPKAPDIKILVTSRERLNLSEEWLFPLQGLAFPKSRVEPNEQSFSAIDLFSQRAKQVNQNFDSTQEIGHIREICQLVDGMPLGIELAASWVSQLSCAEVAVEIKRELDFLSSDLRNIPDRHRSIRAVFTHSWQQLSLVEQQILQKLSLFRGGFQREAAEQIAAATLKDLSALVHKSMIRRNANGRYDIHELMRQFAAEKLSQDPDLEKQTRDKHDRFFLDFIVQQNKRLHGENGRFVVSDIRRDLDNIRAAWRWGVTQFDVALLSNALLPFLNMFLESQGWYLEAEETAYQAYLSLNPAKQQDDAINSASNERSLAILRLQLLAMTGHMQWRHGKFERGLRLLEETVSQLNPANDSERRIQAIWRFFLGNAIYYRGEFARTRAIAEEISIFFQEQNEPLAQSLSLYLAGLAAEVLGDYEAAEQLAQQSLQLAEDSGSHYQTFYSYRLLGKGAIANGNYLKAEQYLQSSFYISWSYGFPAQSMLHLNELGDAARLRGNGEEAEEYYRRSLAISSEANSPTAMASSYWGLGNLALATGAYPHAKALFAKSKQASPMIKKTPGGPGWVSIALGELVEARQIFLSELELIFPSKQAPLALDKLAGLAHIQAQASQPERALELVGLILSHSSAAFETKERAQQLREKLAVLLPPTVVDRAEARGKNLALWATVEAFIG